ncbi:peroxynitrite isomerase THAP4 [Patella vulgata]|uniref:peroxynitrite isomerase THAP4 n=1 Tax=Patella vulgata TaxID=6465 RepID=UPI0021805401|nr:peroxynitrite isomerase THAP4 [Patella vulgata]
MVRSCCAENCVNRDSPENKKKGITFHCIPKAPERRLKWLLAINRRDPTTNKLWEPKNSYVALCSEHFKSEEFFFSRHAAYKHLDPNSVPSIFFSNKKPKRKKKDSHTSTQRVSQDDVIALTRTTPTKTQSIKSDHTYTDTALTKYQSSISDNSGTTLNDNQSTKSNHTGANPNKALISKSDHISTALAQYHKNQSTKADHTSASPTKGQNTKADHSYTNTTPTKTPSTISNYVSTPPTVDQSTKCDHSYTSKNLTENQSTKSDHSKNLKDNQSTKADNCITTTTDNQIFNSDHTDATLTDSANSDNTCVTLKDNQSLNSDHTSVPQTDDQSTNSDRTCATLTNNQSTNSDLTGTALTNYQSTKSYRNIATQTKDPNPKADHSYTCSMHEFKTKYQDMRRQLEETKQELSNANRREKRAKVAIGRILSQLIIPVHRKKKFVKK